MSNREKIIELVKPKLDELGCFLVDIRENPAVNKYELFIDNDEGVTIQACETVSRYLQFIMNNDPSFPQNFTLDVSSPGADNPFKVMRQYEKNIGRVVEVLTMAGIRKEGELLEVTESDLKLAVHHPVKKKGMKPQVSEEIIPFSEIRSTKRKISF